MSIFAEKLYNQSPIWLQNILISIYGYNLYRKRYAGNLYQQIHNDIERLKHLSLQEQKSYQAERLHEMIKYCRLHIPYYQNLFNELGLSEKDFTELSHLQKLPILDKQQLRQYADQFRAPNIKPYMIQNTSGSTGTPLSVAVDEYTYKLAMALLVDHEQSHGVRFGAKRATFAGRMIQPVNHYQPPFSRFNHAENQRLFSSYHINNHTFPYYKAELNAFQPEEIIGYPSAIYDIANQFHLHGEKPNFIPKAIVTNSETLLAWQRDRIESVFGARIFDYYGTAEYVTFAGQCGHGHYHLHPLIGITEVIETAQSEGCGESKFAEVVATSLTNRAMPLLRYRIGDLAKMGNGQCSCGKPGAYLSMVIGRVDDVILTEDGRRIGRIDHIFKGLEGIKEAQVIQKSAAYCVVKIVKANSQLIVDEQKLINNIKQRTSDGMKVEINYVDHIPRGANGKFKSVIREI